MTLRRLIAVFVFAILATSGSVSAATFDTPEGNFSVEAPTPELARTFGERAEYFRKEKAIQWLGQEMPRWPRRCPLHVIVNMGGAGGATTFSFGSDGKRPIVTSQHMEIRGEVKQLLNSVLPHEVTHTVLAYSFGRPVPRWADEGGSVLSENDEERYQHDVRCRELLNQGRGIRLRVLFRMTEYPKDMIVLYAQGYSITAYLVEKGGGGREGRGRLLQFLASGMDGNSSETWNTAARQVYGFDSVDAMEAAWLDYQRNPSPRTAARNPGNLPATPTAAAGGYAATDTARIDVRSSAAPAIPVLEPPVRAARGTAPDTEPVLPSTAPAIPSAAPTSPAVPSAAPTAPAVRPMVPDFPVLLPPELPGPGRR